MGALLAPIVTLPPRVKAEGRLPVAANSRLNGIMETPSRIAMRSSLALIWKRPSGVSSGAAAPPVPGCSLEPLRPILEPSSDRPRSR